MNGRSDFPVLIILKYTILFLKVNYRRKPIYFRTSNRSDSPINVQIQNSNILRTQSQDCTQKRTVLWHKNICWRQNYCGRINGGQLYWGSVLIVNKISFTGWTIKDIFFILLYRKTFWIKCQNIWFLHLDFVLSNKKTE